MTSTAAATMTVPTRFRGPARSGNGGFVSGALAEALAGTAPRAVTVTLRQPPPLDAGMRVTAVDEGAELGFGGAVVARALLSDRPVEPVEGVSWEEAVAASATPISRTAGSLLLRNTASKVRLVPP